MSLGISAAPGCKYNLHFMQSDKHTAIVGAKITKKIYIPVRDHPEINYLGYYCA